MPSNASGAVTRGGLKYLIWVISGVLLYQIAENGFVADFLGFEGRTEKMFASPFIGGSYEVVTFTGIIDNSVNVFCR